MWSTLGLELLRAKNVVLTDERMFQRPLGLIPHFYSDAGAEGITEDLVRFQCPLGLIPHFYKNIIRSHERIFPRFQCPLGLIPHFYGTPSKT